MLLALEEARKAAAAGEVPTGCVIVQTATGRILARTHNLTEALQNATSHAEMLAIAEASKANGNWRLSGTRLYVTKEPCSMCAGAIVLARPDAVVWGVGDPKRGGASVFDIFANPALNHHPEVVAGVLEEPCREVLQSFFRARRKKETGVKDVHPEI